MPKSKARLRNKLRPVTHQRLDNAITTFEADLDSLIEHLRLDQTYRFPYNWDQKSKLLLGVSKQALADRDLERGWRCFEAAARFYCYGLDSKELKNEARITLVEATDEEKHLTRWRKKSIADLLADETGNLKTHFSARDVVRAKRILDEHHDNTYHKVAIIKTRLRLLSITGLAILAGWVAYPPLILSPPTTETSAFASSNRLVWLAIIVSGALGSVVSGFTASISADLKKSRIPAELSASTIIFARLFLAMLSAVVVSVFLRSGVLKFAPPSYELLLAIAFVAGFSDRFLQRAIEAAGKAG